MERSPFSVEVIRCQDVESRHTVHAVIYDALSKKFEIYGDPDLLVFPRSSIKPIQALPILLTGAGDFYSISESELALACASHRGELIHTKGVANWLRRIGLSETDLECGTHPPGHPEALAQLFKEGRVPSPIHNNCSGKHTGMLMTALFCGEDLINYSLRDHPVQKRVIKTLEQYAEYSVPSAKIGVDGCSLPAPVLPLKILARAFGNFINWDTFSTAEAIARRRIYRAFTNLPDLTCGSDQFCSKVMRICGEDVLLKGGAEGVLIGTSLKRQRSFAIKVADGAGRAAEVVAAKILSQMNLISLDHPIFEFEISNWRGIVTGGLR